MTASATIPLAMGLTESAALVAETFGWAPFGIEETIEPEIAL